MNAYEYVMAAFGFLIIAAAIWNIIRSGIARSNGQRPEFDDAWFSNDWPAGRD